MSDQKTLWWRERQTNLERKRTATLRPAYAQPGDSFLIVTEGKVSEPVYFELLRGSLQLSTVTVRVMPGDTSDPRVVIQTAADQVKELTGRVKRKKTAANELEKFDHVWAVVDTDVATRQGFWNDVVKMARELKINIAHSTPCFEYWLLLHLQKTTRSDLVNGYTAKRVFRDEIGSDYSTNLRNTETAFTSIIPKWPTAVVNAQQVRQHHELANTPYPANPSTEVDLLVCALNDSAQSHIRKIPCR